MFLRNKTAFTLIELLLVIGIIAVLASIVILAINPTLQLSKAQDAKRTSNAREIKSAINQYIIDNGYPPAGLSTTDQPICSYGAADTTDCLDLDVLVDENYLVTLERDVSETDVDHIGYTISQSANGFISSVPLHLGQSGGAGNNGSGGGGGGGGSALMASITAKESANEGEIILTLDFPDDVSEFDSLDIRRIVGATPPNSDCSSDGVVATTYTTFTDTTFTDTGLTSGEIYSYRFCINLVGGGVSADQTEIAIAGELELVTSCEENVVGSCNDRCAQIGRTCIDTGTDANATDSGYFTGGSACSWLTGPGVTCSTSTFGNPAWWRCLCESTSITYLALDNFSAAAGSTDGEIVITIDFPVDTTEYSEVVIRRVSGSTAPNADCSSDGTEVSTLTTFTDTAITDTGLTPGQVYSYRACVTDVDSTEFNNAITSASAYQSVHVSACLPHGSGASCNAYCAGIGLSCVDVGTDADGTDNGYFSGGADCSWMSGGGVNCSSTFGGLYWRCRCM